MVVLINDTQLTEFSSTKALYGAFPPLVERAERFKKQKCRKVSGTGTLYVAQNEYAVVQGTDNRVNFVGSDRAYTCHIVLLYHEQSKGVAVAHFDDSGDEEK